MRKLAALGLVFTWLSSCGKSAPTSPQTPPPDVGATASPDEETLPKKWAALQTLMLTLPGTLKPYINEAKSSEIDTPAFAAEFLVTPLVEGNLEIKAPKVELSDCTTDPESSTRARFILVSRNATQVLSPGAVALLKADDEYLVRMVISNGGQCKNIRVSFEAHWKTTAALLPARSGANRIDPRPPQPESTIEQPILSPIAEDDGKLGTCMKAAIEAQAPAGHGRITMFRSQPVRNESDPSVAEYVYFTDKRENGHDQSRFTIRFKTLDGRAWQYVFESFAATAYANSTSLTAKVREQLTGKMEFTVNLESCKISLVAAESPPPASR